jgi:hypothetical protein
MNYIETNRHILAERHYILSPIGTETHWFNFRVNQMRNRTAEWGSEFCIVLNLSRTTDTAYIIPYVAVESLFVLKYMARENDRWVGNLIDENLRVVSGKFSAEVFVGDYYRRFDLLQGARQPVPPRCVVNYDALI